MLLLHPGHPGRAVRLAYCANVHPGASFGAVLEGLESVTLPLRERLAPGQPFGVGMYLPASVALALAEGETNREREYLADFLEDNGLDPFTWNAFPYGGFGEQGLKERVFLPAWDEPERVMYTAACANLATLFAGPARSGAPGQAARHLSISTHTGMHASQRADHDQELAREALLMTAEGFAGLEEASGWRCILSLEAEPRANCNDTAELAALHAQLHAEFEDESDLMRRYLGTCLDACHAAVEFEDPAAAFANATASGVSLGKLQLTSALSLSEPAKHGAARERLLAMAEERYLHQVTARGPGGPGGSGGKLARADDLPAAEALWTAGDADWREAAEWRCHFHVPLDRDTLGGQDPHDPDDPQDSGALTTTRTAAAAQLATVLADPERWGTDELHVELETYTWDVLPAEARGPGALVDALEREYRHALELLASHGWTPA